MQDSDFIVLYAQISKLLSQIKDCATSTSTYSALANIYTIDDKMQGFRYSKLSGIISLQIDRHFKSIFFRMYDLDSLDLTFECELYYGFDMNYRFVNPTAYCFDYFQGIIAIEFRNQNQAQEMIQKISSISPRMSALQEILEERRKQSIQKKQSQGFFNRILKQLKGQEKQNFVEQIKILSVEKKSSIAYNPTTGTFDTSNIPPEWKQIFDSMGLQITDLQNKDTAGLIYEQIMVYHAKKQAQQDPDQKQNIQQKIRASIAQLELPHPPSLNIQPPTLVIPPPLIPLNLKSPQLPTSHRKSTPKQDLLQQIREGRVKLKPVQAKGQHMMIDASQMNRNERDSLATHLKKELQKRKKYLGRLSIKKEDSKQNEDY